MQLIKIKNYVIMKTMNPSHETRKETKRILKMMSAMTDLVVNEVKKKKNQGLPIPKWQMKTYLDCRKITKKKYRQIQIDNPTAAEKLIYKELIPLGFKFQHVVSFEGGVFYILDFYHRKCKLAVEIDGSVHETLSQKDYDLVRDERLSKKNIRVFRFTNKRVFLCIKDVIETIKQGLQASKAIPALRISENKFTYR